MKALRQNATPRNYEIWYAYASGYHPALNQQINATLKAKGSISEADLVQIYEKHLSPSRLTERIDQVGVQVKGEIDQVMAMIDAALGSATSYTESLAGATEQLGQSKDREGVRAIIESLVQTTGPWRLPIANWKSGSALPSRKLMNYRKISRRYAPKASPIHSRNWPTANSSTSRWKKPSRRIRAERVPLSLMLTDIDHFKAFNDNFGHLTGDQVLRLVAVSVRHNVKGKDTAARYGGEEFAVILPNTVLRAAVTVAEHIRRAVMAKELMKRSTGEHLGRMTISIGVAAVRAGDTGQSLIERADTCLYAAKRHGRNRVMCETDPEVVADSAEVA